MFRKIHYTLVLLLCSLVGLAQPYGNEWIHYNQQYFAFKIVEEGVYRISYNTLLNAGVPLGSFDPRSFQLFAKGQEQALIVRNEQTGLFLPGDYLEFYAERNTGWFDQGFYENPNHQPNANYSLINDTLTYYITWNNLLTNKRYTVSANQNFAGHSPAPYFWFSSRMDYTGTYYAGETNTYGVTEPEYTRAEGWFDAALNLGQSRSYTLASPAVYAAGPQAEVELVVVGASNYRPLNPDSRLQVQFAGMMIDTLYEGYELLRFKRQVAANALNPAGTSFVFSSINSLGSTVDRSAVAYIAIRYPRSFNLGNVSRLRMQLPPSAGTQTLLAISGLNVPLQDTVWVYDLSRNSRSQAFREGDTYRVLVPNAGQLRDCLLISSSGIKTITALRPVSADPENFARFRNFGAAPHLHSDFLMITHQSLWNQAAQYRDYRNTTGYKVLLVDVEELYHQFGYGIGKHPLAIRNFARYTLQTYTPKPRMLFLIGKGLPALSYRKNTTHYRNTLLPSMGYPASDILFTAGLAGGLYAPGIATGRLAARNPQHVSLYLEKVKQYEAAQKTPQEWMKRILHFGGGSSVNEQNILAGYLSQYRNIVQDTLMGGNVLTFLKSSTAPIQINQSDSLRQLINNGVSIMTFFGHAAGIGFDISIDYPSEYNNFGKYPFLVANSCFAGDIFGTGMSSSEEFVLIENKGTIGYLASTVAAGAFELNRYSNEFFRNISSRHYGKPVGISIQEAIKAIEVPNVFIKNIALVNTLHGDPAVVINAQPKPDYEMRTEGIFSTPRELTAELDSFTVHVVSLNLGKAIRDSMFVSLERRFADGSVENYLKRVATPLYRDTLSFRLPLDRARGIGLNQFTATLDVLNQIDELNKANNRASANLFVRSADVVPVYPYRYAIVGSPQVELKASTGDPFAAPRPYVFQIDTSAAFSNPLAFSLSQRGGVLKWTPPISLTDSAVYFWRVSVDSVYAGSYNWRSSSFQYIPNRTGWSQTHFDQFDQNTYRFVNYNDDHRRWDFINNLNSIQAQTGIYPYLVWTEQYIKKNGVVLEVFSCLADVGNGMYFAVFDPISAEHWISYNQGGNLGQYENYHCRERPNNTFDYYSTSELWLQRMENFLKQIPDGYYVLGASHRNHNAQNYPESLYQAFESIGSGNIRNLINSTPYLIFGRKGMPLGSANEVIGAGITSHIQLNDSIRTNWNEGYILSETVGPARAWDSLHWHVASLEDPDTDVVSLDVVGVRPDGSSVILISGIDKTQSPVRFADYGITASAYPYLRLQANMQDDVNRTPAQMRHWRVFYDAIPELALDPSTHYLLDKDTVQEGRPVIFSTAIRNISPYDFDSLRVDYYVMDSQRQIYRLEYPRQAPLKQGEVLIDTIRIETRGLAGNNNLWVEVNPGNDQLEQYFFNNIGTVPFVVEKDRRNPLLEVNFDGVQIMDGDLVSAQPHILITLRDENPYLELGDTTLIKVFLQSPGSNDLRRIYFYEEGKQQMDFYPASLPDNTCKVSFNPVFELDGKYTLRVQATDKSMNESGQEDYMISFEVINQSTITEVLNWPNPFTTATHFVFTLTGHQLPTMFKIQIMTITGKVVREIDMSELGPLRIGRNITQYAWDGTDQYGDRLANGVYLYRILTHIDGKSIDLNPTEASRYFKQGFGKMYLMR